MNETGDPSRILGDVVYTSRPHAYTHPQNLYLTGSLFGLNPPDFRAARVLDLGCAGGGNILPLAVDYPKARFTGYDISENHIAEANRHKKALGVRNLQFEIKNIADVGPADGEFDYIIVHGIFSWVPDSVRADILRICRDNLSRNGMAYISYNAMPGWGALQPIREALLYHIGDLEGPLERLGKARAFLDVLSRSAAAAKNDRYSQALNAARKAFARDDFSYALYEYTGPFNKAFFFHEMAAMAAAYNLQYVGEAIFADMKADNLPPEAAALLGAARDFGAHMQYLDFFLNRQFHRSIFTHAEAPLSREISKDVLFRHYLVPAFEPADASSFRGTRWKEARFSANDDHIRVLLSALAEHRETPVRLDDILAAAGKKLKIDKDEFRKIAAEKVFGLFMKGLIFLAAEPARHVVRVSPRPEAYGLARYQAGLPESAWVTNCRHEAVQMPDKLALFVLKNLDGAKTVDDLVKLAFGSFGGKVAIPGDPRAIIGKEIPRILEKIAERHLLVA